MPGNVGKLIAHYHLDFISFGIRFFPSYCIRDGFAYTCHGRLARWRTWSACDVGEAKEGLENDLWRRWSDGKVWEWTFSSLHHMRWFCFTYVTAHSPTLPLLPTLLLLHLRHSSFSNPSVASPTSQLILQPFPCFTYVTAYFPTLHCFTYVRAHSLTLPLLHLRHSSFS